MIVALTIAFLLSFTSVAAINKPNVFDFNSNVSSNVVLPPISVYEIGSLDKYQRYQNNADNILLTIGRNGKIVSFDGQVIDTIDNVFSKGLHKNNIICFKISDNEALKALVEYYNIQKLDFKDITIVSEDKTIIKTVKTSENPVIASFRCAYDISRTLDISLDEERQTANKIGANILIINNGQASDNEVRRQQSLGKSIWISVEEGEMGFSTRLSRGASGIIVDNISQYNSYLNRLGNYGKVHFHSQFNISRRGDSHNYAENSIEAFKSAVNYGAEGIETDFRFTKDKKIVVMADASIDRTTNGHGYIYDFNYDDLRNYRIIKGYGRENVTPSMIPDIDEVFSFLKNNNAILYANVRARAEDSEFTDMLAEKIKEYNMENRIVLMGSNEDEYSKFLLSQCRIKMPNIWALNVFDSNSSSNIPDVYNYCSYNNFSYIENVRNHLNENDTFASELLKRGYMPFFWTNNDNVNSHNEFIKYGFYFMSNHYCTSYASIIKDTNISTATYSNDIVNAKVKKVSLNARTYNGEINEIDSDVLDLYDNNRVASIVCPIASSTYLYDLVSIKRVDELFTLYITIPIVSIISFAALCVATYVIVDQRKKSKENKD